MPQTLKINGDGAGHAQEGVRSYLEACRAEARKLVPNAEFALSDDAQYVYGDAADAALASERGLIEYAVRFANGEEEVGKRRTLEMPGKLRELLVEQVRLNPEGGSGGARLNAELAEHIEARRAKLRRSLAAVCYWHKAGQRINVLDTNAEHYLRDVWALPTLRHKPNLHLAPFWIITSASAFETFVNVILLDENRPLGASLRRCALDACPRFFLQPAQAGRPQRYCTDEHAKVAHENGAKFRAQDSRKRASARELFVRKYGRRAGTPAEIKEAIDAVFSRGATVEHIAEQAWRLLQAQRKHR
jgi:hypothetical protein